MHQPIHPTTQLDLIRAEQAQRRRRAAIERTVRAARQDRRRRRQPMVPSLADGYRDPWPDVDRLGPAATSG